MLYQYHLINHFNMKSILTIAFIAIGVGTRAQITNQSALTTAGGYQGQIGNYYFEYSLGDLFTATGQSPAMINTTGIIQPLLSEEALPVTIVAFNAQKSGENHVALSWTTAQETRSDRFEVQRSLDGKQWLAIGTIKAGGETNHTVAHYAFIDQHPVGGANLYRLKMIDTDASFAYSKIVSLEINNQFMLNVYPNPASDYVLVDTDSKEQIARVTAYNSQGAAVYNSVGSPVRPIDVKALRAGIYLILVEKKNGRSESRRIIISK
jgi:hypothetical protein